MGDPEREVIVEFRGDAIHLGNPTDRSLPDAIASIPADLRGLLRSAGVDRVRSAFPNSLTDIQAGLAQYPQGIAPPALSRVFILRAASEAGRSSLLDALSARSDVVYAEANSGIQPMGTPNDASFRNQWNLQNLQQAGGNPGSDTKAWSAWDLLVGNPTGVIGIVGEATNVKQHTEFGTRLSGTIGTGGDHATAVAGIAAATGNNGAGIAGVDWLCGIRSDAGSNDAAGAADNMYSAVNHGVRILNNSWAQPCPFSLFHPQRKALLFGYSTSEM